MKLRTAGEAENSLTKLKTAYGAKNKHVLKQRTDALRQFKKPRTVDEAKNSHEAKTTDEALNSICC